MDICYFSNFYTQWIDLLPKVYRATISPAYKLLYHGRGKERERDVFIKEYCLVYMQINKCDMPNAVNAMEKYISVTGCRRCCFIDISEMGSLRRHMSRALKQVRV